MARAVGDWGTTQLRLFKLIDGVVVARATGPGVGATETSVPEVLRGTLRELGLRSGDILLCGMAGSRIGLIDSGYRACPVDVDGWRGHATSLDLDDFSIRITPGVSGTNLLGGPDVMRGEEAQVFGAMALRPELAFGCQFFLLPGTHSKWVETQDGTIVGFHTFPTGEMFAWLSRASTLAAQSAAIVASDDANGFATGLDRSARAGALSALFEARAGQLIDHRSAAWTTGYLSGALIGGEVREALELLSRAVVPVIIGEPALAALYAQALARCDVLTSRIDGAACALAGLGTVGNASGVM